MSEKVTYILSLTDDNRTRVTVKQEDVVIRVHELCFSHSLLLMRELHHGMHAHPNELPDESSVTH